MAKNSDGALRKHYLGILESLVSPAEARIELEKDQRKPGTDFTISVSPRNRNAARIEMDIADRDFAFLHAGEGTTFEIPPEGGVNLSLDQAQQIRTLIRAIADGHFEETLEYAGEKLVGGSGTLQLPNDEVTIHWSKLHLALRSARTTRKIIYGPYRVTS